MNSCKNTVDIIKKRLLTTSFFVRNDSLSEIDSTLCFCNEFFGDAL